MHLLSEKRPPNGLRAIRTECMSEEEHWYAFWEQGRFVEYGTGYGMRLKREIHNVVAWRNLTNSERRWVRQQRQQDQSTGTLK